MADEIYINTGSSFQQPYQGQSLRSAQSLEIRQTPAQTPANLQSPFTYQHRQPFTYRNPVNAQTPFIRNAQQPFTYSRQGQTPFTYNYRSPFTYARQGQTPVTYARQGQSPYIANARQPSTYRNPVNAQSPYIANARQPSTYRNPVNAQSPYIANGQTPFTYSRQGQTPFTYQHRQPVTYARQGQTPFTYAVQTPYPYIATTPYTYNATGTVPASGRTPVSYIYSPLDDSGNWGPNSGATLTYYNGGTGYGTTSTTPWVTGGIFTTIQSSAYFPQAYAFFGFEPVDTTNNRIPIYWTSGTSASYNTVYYDYIDFQGVVTSSSTFSVKYDTAGQSCNGGGCSNSLSSTNLPTYDGYNAGTYYSLTSSSGKYFEWMAEAYSFNGGSDTTNVSAQTPSFTVRAVSGSSTYTTTYLHNSWIQLNSTYGLQKTV